MPDLLLRGGEVIDERGRRRADVLIGDDGLIEAVEGTSTAPPWSTPAGAWSPRGWSISTPTCEAGP